MKKYVKVMLGIVITIMVLVIGFVVVIKILEYKHYLWGQKAIKNQQILIPSEESSEIPSSNPESSEVSSESISSEVPIPMELHEDIQVPVETLEKLYQYYYITPAFKDVNDISLRKAIDALCFCYTKDNYATSDFNFLFLGSKNDPYQFKPFTGDQKQVFKEFNITDINMGIVGSISFSKLNEFAKAFFGPNAKTYTKADIIPEKSNLVRTGFMDLKYSEKNDTLYLMCLPTGFENFSEYYVEKAIEKDNKIYITYYDVYFSRATGTMKHPYLQEQNLFKKQLEDKSNAYHKVNMVFAKNADGSFHVISKVIEKSFYE